MDCAAMVLVLGGMKHNIDSALSWLYDFQILPGDHGSCAVPNHSWHHRLA